MLMIKVFKELTLDYVKRKTYKVKWTLHQSIQLLSALSGRLGQQIGFHIINPLALELDIYSLAHHLCKI